MSMCRHPMTGTIQPYNCRCTNGTSECNNGQSCFWFSQGCTIGCPNCDSNGTRIPGWDHCPEVSKSNITRLLPKYRTANQGAAVGTVADVFRFNPWSAPGTAPVLVSLVNSVQQCRLASADASMPTNVQPNCIRTRVGWRAALRRPHLTRQSTLPLSSRSKATTEQLYLNHGPPALLKRGTQSECSWTANHGGGCENMAA